MPGEGERAKRKAAIASVSKTRDNIAELQVLAKKPKKKQGPSHGTFSSSAGDDIWLYPEHGQADLDFLAALPEECMTRDSRMAVQQLVQMREHKRRGEDLPFLPKGVTLRLPSSPFSGVGRKKRAGGIIWSASVSAKTSCMNLGNFQDEVLAARAHDLAALLFCEMSAYRKLNFQEWTYATELLHLRELHQEEALQEIKAMQGRRLDRHAAWCNGRSDAHAGVSQARKPALLASLAPSVLAKALPAATAAEPRKEGCRGAGQSAPRAGVTSQKTLLSLSSAALARIRTATAPFDLLTARSHKVMTVAAEVPRLDVQQSIDAVKSLLVTDLEDTGSGWEGAWPMSPLHGASAGDMDYIEELAALMDDDGDLAGSLSLAATGAHQSQGGRSSVGGPQGASQGTVKETGVARQPSDVCERLREATAGVGTRSPEAWAKRISGMSGPSSLATCTALDCGLGWPEVGHMAEVESPAVAGAALWDVDVAICCSSPCTDA